LDDLEIIPVQIPLDCYEKRVTELINGLLKIDDHFARNKVNGSTGEVA
jgi:hypothetical protein